jgi:predicted permease
MSALLRHSLRQIRKNPAFAATAIVTLAIGIGSSAAIFAILDAVLLEPLPFPQPDRLVAVSSQPDGVISIPTMKDYASRSTAFASLAAYRSWSPAQMSIKAPPARRILAVSQGFFPTLGAHFALGASWPITDNEQDCSGQAIVSQAYWKSMGGGSALGNRMLNLDGRNYQVAAVLPAEQGIEGSYELNQPEVFVPVGCDSQEHPNSRGDQAFFLIGRLRPGVTVAQANADLVRVDATLRKDYPTDYGAQKEAFSKPTLVIPYVELLAGADTRPALLMTMAACGLLLLIACTNLANLLLARNTRRRAEFATRATLGASLAQLFRQLLVESSVLVALGTAGGIALAMLLLKLVKSSRAFHPPRLENASISPAVLAFTIAISVVVVLVLTLLPGRRALRPGILRDLEGAQHSSAGRSLRLAGRVLVMAQITSALVLVTCAGWMIGSVYLLLHQPLGFAPEHLLMVRTLASELPQGNEGAEAELKLRQIAAGLGRLPGITAVAVTDHPPPSIATISALTRILSSASSR